jgi:hypothetical protein
LGLDIVFADGGQYCNTFFSQYITQKLQVLVVPCLIILINFVAKKTLWFSGKWEKKHCLPEETYASARNMALLSIVNTGLVILITNIDWGYNLLGLDLLGGKYNSFSVQWYRVVGSTICVTVALMIISVNMSNFGFHWGFACLRLCDRGCHNSR